MSDPFLGEIKIVAFSFAPSGFAFCNGQLLPLQQYTALYSLLGINYGGNGTSNFALPNFQATAPMHWGNGNGLTPRAIGEQDGSASITLDLTQIPAHAHPLNSATLNPANASQNVATPTTQALFGPSSPGPAYIDVPTTTVNFLPTAIGVVGGSQPHQNLSPIIALNFVIALQGQYPARN